MKPSVPPDMDSIDRLMSESWETAPVELMARLENIPAEFEPAVSQRLDWVLILANALGIVWGGGLLYFLVKPLREMVFGLSNVLIGWIGGAYFPVSMTAYMGLGLGLLLVFYLASTLAPEVKPQIVAKK